MAFLLSGRSATSDLAADPGPAADPWDISNLVGEPEHTPDPWDFEIDAVAQSSTGPMSSGGTGAHESGPVELPKVASSCHGRCGSTSRSRSRSRSSPRETATSARADSKPNIILQKQISKPKFLPGTEWWANPMWHAAEDHISRMPASTLRPVTMHAFCAGLSTESFAAEVVGNRTMLSSLRNHEHFVQVCPAGLVFGFRTPALIWYSRRQQRYSTVAVARTMPTEGW
jgi:hypothetical protein